MSDPDPQDHAARLARIRRPADYPLTIALINPVNRRLVGTLHRWNVAPNGVTWTSLWVSVAAASTLWLAAREGALWAVVAAPVLAYFAHLLDALDGDLARYSGRASRYGAALDPTLDRVREVLYVVAVASALNTLESWRAGALCVAGALTYYYTVDVQVRRLLDAGVHDLRRHVVTAGAVEGVRVKLGLYEPFMYGLTLAAVAGFGQPALELFAALFWLAWVGQIIKMSRESARAKRDGL